MKHFTQPRVPFRPGHDARTSPFPHTCRNVSHRRDSKDHPRLRLSSRLYSSPMHQTPCQKSMTQSRPGFPLFTRTLTAPLTNKPPPPQVFDALHPKTPVHFPLGLPFPKSFLVVRDPQSVSIQRICKPHDDWAAAANRHDSLFFGGNG